MVTREEKGITLITLIITVIILLILAGTAISLSVDSNDLFGKATTTTKRTNEGALKESVCMAFLMKDSLGSGETFKEKMESQMIGVNVVEADNRQDVLYIDNGKTRVTVYENGDVLAGNTEFWDGNTIECPVLKNENNTLNWYISTPGQLKFLADYINNGNGITPEEGTENGVDLTSYVTSAGYNPVNVTIEEKKSTVYLMNNIDFGAREGEGTTPEQKWETQENEQVRWTTMGKASPTIYNFTGIFEGNGYSIKGLYIKQTGSYAGIFGSAYSIKNLTIKDSYISGGSFSGAFAGYVKQGNLENCNAENVTVISSNSYTGGIAGGVANSMIKNCSFKGFVTGIKYLGGICGAGKANFDGCINYGEVIGIDGYIGGIGGYFPVTVNVNNSTNYGNIRGTGSDSVVIGGIIGNAGISNIKNCNNNGSISGTKDIGGIAGGSSDSCHMENCTNNGIITGQSDRVGGIAGETGTTESIIEKCINNGTVTGGGNYTGGIIGIVITDGQDPSDVEPSIVRECYNTGSVKGKNYTGGIIGQLSQYDSSVEKCYNIGLVYGTADKTGGIAGAFGRSSKIYNCYNMTEIIGINYVGGIVGYTYGSACKIKNCYNVGKVNGTSVVGGIIGKNQNSTTILNSYYLNGTAEKDQGSETGNSLNKTKEFITTTFVETANAEQEIWSVNSEQNDGWPSL